MKTIIQKWGNSLALRIPKAFADDAGLRKETPVDLSLVEGKLVITPAAKTRASLEELLAGVTPANMHREVDTGSSAGNEAW